MYPLIKRETLSILKLAIPMVCTQLLAFAQNIVDIIMAGRHSTLLGASVPLASQLFGLVFVLISGLGIGFSAQISRFLGAKRIPRMRKEFQQGIWLFSIVALITIFITFSLSFTLFLIGAEKSIATEVRNYLLTLALPSGIYIFAFSFRFLLDGMAYPIINTITQSCLIPLNIIGNWYFLNHTQLGAQGMAISTGICYVCYALILSTLFIRSKRVKSYRLFKDFARPKWMYMRRIVAIGMPIGLAVFMEYSIFVLVGLMLSRMGAVYVSASQVANNFSGMMFMLPLGISAALTVRIAHAYGAREYALLRMRAYCGIGLCVWVMFFSMVGIMLFRDSIASLYLKDMQAHQIASNVLIIVAIFQLLDGSQVAFSGVLRGLNDTKITLLYAFIGYWLVGAPVGIILGSGFGFSVYGYWIGCCAGLLSFCILACMRVRYQLKRLKS